MANKQFPHGFRQWCHSYQQIYLRVDVMVGDRSSNVANLKQKYGYGMEAQLTRVLTDKFEATRLPDNETDEPFDIIIADFLRDEHIIADHYTKDLSIDLLPAEEMTLE